MNLSYQIWKEVSTESALTIDKIVNALPKNFDSQVDQLRQELSDLEARYRDAIDVWNTDVLHDFRLNNMLLCNFRKFDNLENAYYGCDFTVKTSSGSIEPIDTLYILGSNGVGKSSLVDALEYMFTNEISEAEIRQIRDHQWYVKHGDLNSEILIFSKDKSWDSSESLEKFRKGFDVRNFFFSENSILNMSKYTPQFDEHDGLVNWFAFFCYLLGLSPVYELYREKGLLDRAVGCISQIKERIAQSNIQQKRTELEELLRDAYMDIGEAQKVKLLLLQEDITQVRHQQDKLDEKELGERVSKFFEEECELDSLYFVSLFKESLDKILMKIHGSENTGQASLSGGGKPQKRQIVPAGLQQVSVGVKDELLEKLNELSKHISQVLVADYPRVSFQTIKGEFEKLSSQEQLETISSESLTVENLEYLLETIDKLKEGLKIKTVQCVATYIDKEFVQTLNRVFEKFLFSRNAENLNVDISNISNGRIEVGVNGVPVHKYFNTFRYRLFCLTVQAIINLKVMKHANFSFPFVFDDVFYANDYFNKAQLYQYFKIVRETAKMMLPKIPLQILFFTHDELLVSCLNGKSAQGLWDDTNFVRLLDPQVAVVKDMNMLRKLKYSNQEYEYYNLLLKMYE